MTEVDLAWASVAAIDEFLATGGKPGSKAERKYHERYILNQFSNEELLNLEIESRIGKGRNKLTLCMVGGEERYYSNPDETIRELARDQKQSENREVKRIRNRGERFSFDLSDDGPEVKEVMRKWYYRVRDIALRLARKVEAGREVIEDCEAELLPPVNKEIKLEFGVELSITLLMSVLDTARAPLPKECEKYLPEIEANLQLIREKLEARDNSYTLREEKEQRDIRLENLLAEVKLNAISHYVSCDRARKAGEDPEPWNWEGLLATAGQE